MSDPFAFVAQPPESEGKAALYEADLAADGYVNNMSRIWGWRPDQLSAFQTLRIDLTAASSLSKREFAVLVAATAAARGDSYCALAWGTTLAGLSDDDTAAAVLTGRDADLSDRESALAWWAQQVVRDPNATTQADVDALREAGLDDREITEATTWIAYRMAFSTINDALGAPPDVELARKAPVAVREAVTYGRKP